MRVHPSLKDLHRCASGCADDCEKLAGCIKWRDCAPVPPCWEEYQTMPCEKCGCWRGKEMDEQAFQEFVADARQAFG